MPTLPAISPSWGVAPSAKARVLKVKFGDGYSQRAGDGLNTIETRFAIVWKNRSKVDIDTLHAFFIARGGHESFDWTPPDELTARKFICAGWKGPTKQPALDAWTLSATFEEVFDL